MYNGACYIRVSTDIQTEFSPDAQLKAIMEYATSHNIVIDKKHIYYEEGISGKNANKRPIFLKMIKEAKSKPKPFDYILVHAFDRFARNVKESRIYKELLRDDLKINLISITEDFGNDKNGFLLEGIKDILNEYYSLNLADEVRKGMKEKAFRGELQTTPPFGYKAVDNKLVIIEAEALFVKYIFDSYVNGLMNIRSLARYANSNGIKTKRGNCFDTRAISYILNNPVYIGYLKWTHKITKEIIIKKSTHEPIINEKLFNDAQDLLKINKKIYKNKKQEPKNKHFSSGLIKCFNCGKSLVVNNKNYYICSGYVKAKCNKTQSLNIKKIEDILLNIIKEKFKDKITIDFNNKDIDNKSEYNLISNKLDQIELKMRKIKSAYINGIDTINEYKENKNSILKEKELLIKSLKLLSNNAIKYNVNLNDITLYELLISEKISDKIKYIIVHYIFKTVIYDKDNELITVEFNTN